MTQPPLTRRINHLEHDLGVRLFVRHNGGCSCLHRAGEVAPVIRSFLNYLDNWTEAKDGARAAIPRPAAPCAVDH
jgi:DNA-binding transcriptional LysR family regulator